MKPSNHHWGVTASVIANVWFGLGAIYWVNLRAINPLQIISCRVITALPLAGIALFVLRKTKLPKARSDKKILMYYVAAAALQAANWLAYLILVYSGHVIESAIAYFISPVITIFIDFLRGKRNGKKGIVQMISFFIAFTGIIFLFNDTDDKTYIFLCAFVAVTFSLYLLVTKLINETYGNNGQMSLSVHMKISILISFVVFCTMLVFAPLFLSPQASGKFIEFFNLKLDTAAYKNILTPSALNAADIVFLSFSGAIIYIPTLLITLGSCLTGKLGFVGVFQFLDPATAFLVGKLYMREQIIYNRFSMALIVVSIIAYLFSELVFKDKAAIHG